MKRLFIIAIIALVGLSACRHELLKTPVSYDYSKMNTETVHLHRQIESFLYLLETNGYPVKISAMTRIDSLRIDDRSKKITVDFSKLFSFAPFREDNVQALYTELKKSIDDDYRDFDIEIRTLNQPIENLIPNLYRAPGHVFDKNRIPKSGQKPPPIVRRISNFPHPSAGLYNNNLAIWPSHGWYYNQDQDRWMWQRPRMFGTVEDLFPESFVIPFILPMLENAGANVFIPRERDLQSSAVIIDNDFYTRGASRSSYAENHNNKKIRWHNGKEKGYAIGTPPYPINFNPFQSGSYRICPSDTLATNGITWTPSLPDSGYYAVYVSYHRSGQNIDDAHYTVKHLGGQSEFLVNQQIGGNTWVYLGTFKFSSGLHPEKGSVTIDNRSATVGRTVSADAVKFGGGMGTVLQNGRTSGRPAFEEGARYWLQTAGFPDTLVYNINGNTSDYKDDYQSRGEWANYLKGAPFGPNKNRDVSGMGIPIDLSLAFHTDAGLTRGDTTIGTLSIYSLTGADSDGTFPDGMSRLASRDLADIMQTQIVDDIRNLYNPKWNRRSLREAQYSEAFRPNVPAVLLELLSHENFTDMRYGLDPRFRFDVSRAIYKAMLKFVAFQEQRAYVVQPLPVTHFNARFTDSGDVLLNWRPQRDPLESSAGATNYKIYKRSGNGGFDSGRIVDSTSALIKNIRPGTIYSFKVSALNSGGESFPSEILALCRVANKPTLLIINGFERIAPPGAIETNDFSGYNYDLDGGVPYGEELKFTGNQFNFNKNEPWHTDDAPGHGASFADQENSIEPGNSFDFCYVHGQAIRQAGYGFVSAGKRAVMDGMINMNDYPAVDLILGEEKLTHWPHAFADSARGLAYKAFSGKLKSRIKDYLLGHHGAMFVSGAYVASDLFVHTKKYPDVVFGRDILKIWIEAGHASRKGTVITRLTSPLKLPAEFHFNTSDSPDIYRVEAPDAFTGVNGAQTIIRYKENRFSAGTAYRGLDYGIVVFGFPFETIHGQIPRNAIMKGVLGYLLR